MEELPANTKRPRLSLKYLAIYGVLVAIALLVSLLTFLELPNIKNKVSKFPESETQIIADIEKKGLLSPTSGENLKSSNFDDTRPGHENDADAKRRNEFRAYLEQFDFLTTRYYGTGDKSIFDEAVKWKGLIKEKFPTEYEEAEKGGLLEIKEMK